MPDPLIVIRTLHFAACTLALGSVAFAAPPAHERRLRVLTAIALVVAALSGVAWLAVIAARILDVPVGSVLTGESFSAVAFDTRFGLVACLRTALAVLALPLLFLRPRWPAMLATAALMAGIAVTGHAGAGTGLTGAIHIVSDMAHLLAASLWLGGLPALVWLLLAVPGDAAAPTRRFGTVAMVAVLVLIATGVLNTCLLIGWPADPLASPYGRVLALKVAIFAAMLAIAAANRFWLTPRLPEPRALRALATLVAIETALGFGALILVGILGTLPPAPHMHSSAAAINSDAALLHTLIVLAQCSNEC